MRMIRTDHLKLIRHYFANGLDEMYDLEKDPGEKKNLYNDAASRKPRNELQEKLT